MPEHISDNDLLLALDGELPSERTVDVQAHLEACGVCEGRRADLATLSQQVALLSSPDLAFRPQETAVANLISGIESAHPKKTFWNSRSFAVANSLLAVAVAITCIALLPAIRVGRQPVAHPAVTYDLEQAVPPGYISLPYADPALPLDDATVLPVELSAEDLELMGFDAEDAPAEGVQAEILIGMDGWPRAIRIVE